MEQISGDGMRLAMALTSGQKGTIFLVLLGLGAALALYLEWRKE